METWSQRTAVAVAVALFVAAIAAPLIAPFDPFEQSLLTTSAPPLTDGHILGTDGLGRDVLSRMLYGARIAILAPVIALSIGAIIGVPLGYIAGYYRGALEAIIMRLTDLVMTFPALIFAIAVVSVLGPGVVNAMVAVGLLFVPRFIRLVRGSVLSVSEETYIDAAKSLGASDVHLITREIFPNTFSPIIVQLTTGIGLVILAEAALSFLGLSLRPPAASWGVMLQEAFAEGRRAGWTLIWPGMAIVVTVWSFSTLGDALNDRLAQGDTR